MNKIIFILLCILSFQKITEAEWGVGVNYTGLQARYHMPAVTIEARIQNISEGFMPGFRLYKFIANENRHIPYLGNSYIPFLGAEGSWVQSSYLSKGGYLAGGFGGIEINIANRFSLDLDAGFYYVNLMSSLGSTSDTGITINSAIMFTWGNKK